MPKYHVSFYLPFDLAITAKDKKQAIREALKQAREEISNTCPGDYTFSDVEVSELQDQDKD